MKGHALVQKAESVTQGPIGCLCNVHQRPVLHLNVLCPGQFPQPVSYGFQGNPLEVIALAAGQDGNRYLMDLCCGKYENHIGRRFFQCLKQCIKCPD